MQMMTWMLGRLGSRFGLTFEPYERRVMHSALGRFLDQPLDLAVGLVEPDGSERVLPFTRDNDRPGVEQLANCEQFDRINSVTFRGYSEPSRVRLEFNVHSAFYPQNDRLCLMPAFYLEVRVTPVEAYRRIPPPPSVASRVKVFLRLKRPDTAIRAEGDTLYLDYDIPLRPRDPWGHPVPDAAGEDRTVRAAERLRSLNPDATPTDTGDGLTLDLPVTEAGSGVKWRLVWAAHVADPVLNVTQHGQPRLATLRYTDHWPDVAAVVDEAARTRDDRLALSRRFEKILEQAPLDASQRHLMNQAYQNYLGNTFWCTTRPASTPAPGSAPAPGNANAPISPTTTAPATATSTPHDAEPPPTPDTREWFSTWDGSCLFHSVLDVEYNCSVFYLALWPRLLRLLLDQWMDRLIDHPPSGGAFAPHDLGQGVNAARSAYAYEMPVEENANLLLLLDTYLHWTGDRRPARAHADAIDRLTRYLLWADRDASGFPSAGVANTIVDASPAMQYGRKQTYLAVKRAAALRAAAGILRHTDQPQEAAELEARVEADVRKIERAAWLGDHYAVAVDRSAVELIDPHSGKPLPFDQLPGWDAYSIYTGNGLLLPEMIGHPPLLDRDRLARDVYAAARESRGRYGDGHSSFEPNNCRVSQALWRDMLARYLHLGGASSAQEYWDLQVMSNTHAQSMGYTDTYIQNRLLHYPRGVVTLAYFLATPRLQIDRLAPGSRGTYITVDPDRRTPSRWPLLPLADWQAGKIPVCVVDDTGHARIEAMTDPVVIHGHADDPSATVSGIEFIG